MSDPRCFVKGSAFYDAYIVRKASWYVALAVWMQKKQREKTELIKVQFT
jgi:hypothetical protein